MSTFGYNTIGSGGTDNISTNIVWVKAVGTPASNGTLTTISVYCQQSGGADNVFAALYSDSGGAPNSKIAESASGVAAPAAAGWIDISVSASITSGIQYWFALRIGVTHDVVVNIDTGVGTDLYFISGSSFPATQSGASSASERWSVYGTYTPSSDTLFGQVLT